MKMSIKTRYSYGLIVKCNKDYLLIQNRDTEAYIYFFYTDISRWNDKYTKEVFENFSYDEKQKLLYYSFKDIYNDLYVNGNGTRYEKNREIAQRNYNYFQSNSNMMEILEKIVCREMKWLFPKGKKEKDESEIDCAFREFYEETNIDLYSEKHKIDENRYIMYRHYRKFYKIENITKLFILEIDEKKEIYYKIFPNVIRPISVSNETLHAKWINEKKLHRYLPYNIYRNLENTLYL